MSGYAQRLQMRLDECEKARASWQDAAIALESKVKALEGNGNAHSHEADRLQQKVYALESEVADLNERLKYFEDVEQI